MITPSLVWDMPANGDTIYLTFDDGPVPRLTEEVLEILENYHAKATFFCVGENIRKHPAVFEKALAAGHAVGNHTYNHLKGWKTSFSGYMKNVQKCDAVIDERFRNGVPLFRPPHGQITARQIRALKKTHKIIMWDVVAYDFDTKTPPAYSYEKIIKFSRPGTIIVFHDSYKAEKNLKYLLPRYLEYFSARGYQFKKLAF